jgi:NUMOD3 motif-containing protein
MYLPKVFVYGLIDPRNDALRYIGKSSGGLARPRSHACPSQLTENTHKAHWVRSVVRDGSRPKIIILMEVADVTRLSQVEQFFIARFRALGCPLTNATDGGEGAPGHKASLAAREKMSRAGRGRKFTAEHRAAIAAALKGHVVSDETRRKIGAKSKGKQTCLGRRVSAETLAKMSESAKRTSWSRGKRLPESTLRKMREAAKTRQRSSDGTFRRSDST